MQLYLACIELLTYVTFVRLTSVWISGCMVKVFFSFFSWIKICMHKVRLKVVESLEHFSSSVLWRCDAEAWYLPPFAPSNLSLRKSAVRTFCEELRLQLQCNVAGRLFISSLTDHALLLQLSTHDDHALLARLFSPMQGNEMIWGYRGHSWPRLNQFYGSGSTTKKKKKLL
jgi:hypothetical protein